MKIFLCQFRQRYLYIDISVAKSYTHMKNKKREKRTIMLEVFPFISIVCGFILFNNIEWKGLINKILFSIFWFSLLSLLLLGFFSSNLDLKDVHVPLLILSTLQLISIVIIPFRFKFNRLNSFLKGTTILLYLSLFLTIIFFLK